MNWLSRLIGPRSGANDAEAENAVNEEHVRYNAVARLFEFGESYFVCSVAGLAETESITQLPVNIAADELGAAVLRHLSEYVAGDFDYSRTKLTDWPAFRLSKAKTVKAFEAKLWHVDLAIVNGAVIARAHPRRSEHLWMSVYVEADKRDPSAVGTAVLDAIKGAKVLREQGVI